jgi:hypothetical protein
MQHAATLRVCCRRDAWPTRHLALARAPSRNGASLGSVSTAPNGPLMQPPIDAPLGGARRKHNRLRAGCYFLRGSSDGST